MPPGGVQDEVRFEGLSAGGRSRPPVSAVGAAAGKHRPYPASGRPAVRRPFDRGDVRVEAEIDPPLSHLLGEGVSNVVVEAPKKERPAVELGHFDPEAGEHPRQLDRDIAAPDHDEPLGRSGSRSR